MSGLWRPIRRRAYAGINASDVNYSAGRYFGSTATAEAKLPFPAGFEAVGAVAAAAPDVTELTAGQAVATMTYGVCVGLGQARLSSRPPMAPAAAASTSWTKRRAPHTHCVSADPPLPRRLCGVGG